jgi:hypothetical protein
MRTLGSTTGAQRREKDRPKVEGEALSDGRARKIIDRK